MQIFTYDPPVGLPEIIFDDENYVAIDKPSGLLSNPGRAPQTHDCALTRLQKEFSEIHLVHRLDCDTSGVLVFAKNKKAEGLLKKALQERRVKKIYHALIWGIPAANSGTIDAPLAAHPTDRPFQQIDANGKQAITDYCVLDTNSNKHYARVKLAPTTGRTHQLRVHMNYLGHPILGDTFYGHTQAKQAMQRLCLHAKTLSFEHPISGQTITIDAPVPF